MAHTRAKEYAKIGATILGVIGLITGAVIGAIACAHFGPPAIIAGIICGGLAGGVGHAIMGAIAGGIVGFFRKAPDAPPQQQHNEPAEKLGRSAQVSQEPQVSQQQTQDMNSPQSTKFRDMATAQSPPTAPMISRA